MHFKKAKSTSCVEGFNSTCYNTMNVVKGRGFNPIGSGNRTGYFISAINWNSDRSWTGGMELFFNYFNLKTDDYFFGRSAARKAYKNFQNELNYEKNVKKKVQKNSKT